MACNSCKKNGKQPNTPPASPAGQDLTKFAFLSPRQLRLLKQQGKSPGGK